MTLELGVYEGAREGATAYIAGSRADLWVSQSTSTNLLRSSSFLDSRIQAAVLQIPGVDSVESLLRLLSTATIHGEDLAPRLRWA